MTDGKEFNFESEVSSVCLINDRKCIFESEVSSDVLINEGRFCRPDIFNVESEVSSVGLINDKWQGYLTSSRKCLLSA